MSVFLQTIDMKARTQEGSPTPLLGQSLRKEGVGGSLEVRSEDDDEENGLVQSYRLSLPPLLPGLRLLQLGLERLRVPVLSVLVQDVHQVGDVAGGQPQSFDLGQLGVRRHVGDALPQLREGRVDALGPPPLLPVGRGSPLHRPGERVGVHTDCRSVYRNGAGPRYQGAGSVVVVVMVGVQAAGGPAAAIAMVLRAVPGREAVLGGRHIRVTYQPAREVWRSPGILVTPTGRRRRVQGVVVAVVMVHDRVVLPASAGQAPPCGPVLRAADPLLCVPASRCSVRQTRCSVPASRLFLSPSAALILSGISVASEPFGKAGPVRADTGSLLTVYDALCKVDLGGLLLDLGVLHSRAVMQLSSIQEVFQSSVLQNLRSLVQDPPPTPRTRSGRAVVRPARLDL
ncbi:hypothetical protein F7725_005141 [Dissostichus mawsoni]|uniref:Uncharacterized protein n=1 Tax=Dissostichus mawsoni TaxID=36200 RepID=A0A7J5YQJ4_DISMA|nr:hypothetical protein F7725_005141 [Dissostichus mawsoni]